MLRESFGFLQSMHDKTTNERHRQLVAELIEITTKDCNRATEIEKAMFLCLEKHKDDSFVLL